VFQDNVEGKTIDKKFYCNSHVNLTRRVAECKKPLHSYWQLYGNIVRMINPQAQSRPVAGKRYPTKPGECPRFACYDGEHKEATILKHAAWMGHSPGKKTAIF
jgi:hypothetical protein